MASKGSSKQHEKHQLVLANMLREEDNRFCADCHAKGPRWSSWNLGVFMCIRCAGIHRNLGVHISRVKSVNLDSWTPEQIATIQKGGNGKARDKYEANLPANFRRPQDDYAVEQFIRSKYERKLYMSREKSTASKTTQAKTTVAKTTVAKTTQAKRENVKSSKKTPTSSSHKTSEQLLSVPRPASQPKRSTTPPAPPTTGKPLTPSPSAPSITATMATAKPPVDLLTGLTTSPAQQESPWQPSPGQPSLGEDPQKVVKEGIMSLYQTTPTPAHPTPYQTYTAHGYPVHAYQYQQQQMAAMRIAQHEQQQHHVRAVEEQMRNLKGQASPLNGQPFMQPSFQATSSPATAFPQTGGQTLNPQLW